MHFPLICIPVCFAVRVLPGYSVYRKLVREFGETAEFMGTFLPASGDSYLLGMFYGNLKKRLGAEDTAVLISTKGGPASMVKLFPAERSAVLPANKVTNLVHLARFYGYGHLPIRVLHCNHGWMYQQVAGALMGFRGFNFLSLYRAVFDSPGLENAVSPAFDWNKDALERMFRCKGLVPGKTVLLSPYARSMQVTTAGFWKELARRLKENGYTVCTNANGSERAVEGTGAVAIPYRYLVPFLEKAGALICSRSGLADVASTAHCRKIVLYPADSRGIWGVGTALNSFSLNAMGLCEDAKEIEFDDGDGLIERILIALRTP